MTATVGDREAIDQPLACTRPGMAIVSFMQGRVEIFLRILVALVRLSL